MTHLHIWIVRHGDAEGQTASGLDVSRRLTDLGEQQAHHLAERMATHPLRPDALHHSPAERARATAALIGSGLGLDAGEAHDLRVDTPVSVALDFVVEHAASLPTSRAAALAIVGHNPTLEGLAAVLSEGLRAQPKRLRTGEAVLIRFDPADPVGSGTELARERLG